MFGVSWSCLSSLVQKTFKCICSDDPQLKWQKRGCHKVNWLKLFKTFRGTIFSLLRASLLDTKIRVSPVSLISRQRCVVDHLVSRFPITLLHRNRLPGEEQCWFFTSFSLFRSRKDKLTKRRGNGKLIGSSNSAKSGSTKKRWVSFLRYYGICASRVFLSCW